MHHDLLYKHFRVMGRKKWDDESAEEMQRDLEAYLEGFNRHRPHQGRGMNGRTPSDFFTEGIPAADPLNKDPIEEPEMPPKALTPTTSPRRPSVR